MRRAAPSHRHPVPRAVAAAVLAALTLAAGAGQAAAADVQLPAVTSVLPAGEPCAKASTDKAEQRPWSWQPLGMTKAWQFSEGAGVTVAVVDTGVGTDIPALSGRVQAVGGAGEDCVGHGSFAAGLIAAAPGKGVGVAGLAPRADILAIRGTDTRGETTPQQLAAGIRTAADQGAGVIYVGRAVATGKDELTEAVAYASEKDSLVVAPNVPDFLPKDSGTGKTVAPAPWYWPGAAPGALSVVDYGPGGQRPETAPPAHNADLSAPGDAVVSVGPTGSGHYFGSGSSFAAAHVAGAAALVRARHPKMSAEDVARQLTVAGYPEEPPRLDPYGALTALLTDKQGAPPKEAAAHVPPATPTAPRNRALVIASAGGGLLLLVAGGTVVIPRGRARGWRPGGVDGADGVDGAGGAPVGAPKGEASGSGEGTGPGEGSGSGEGSGPGEGSGSGEGKRPSGQAG
ncbi:S8 family serine peptidase [Streptomyces tsukubensis]|uniref:S8 family serine peptidase n=1 Tax=Streptomyces tsukubensis TaxID=83656 RepID=UPI00098FEDB0|nr:S8 family serine peptidase [Streptomyces tsukubensis]QFR94944.1 S8 family serine peptidase [Streptomyces tsukubensis]